MQGRTSKIVQRDGSGPLRTTPERYIGQPQAALTGLTFNHHRRHALLCGAGNVRFRPLAEKALLPIQSRCARKNKIGNQHRDQKCEDTRAYRVVPIRTATGQGGTSNGQES